MPSNHLIFCSPLPLLTSIFPSIRVFSNESALGIRWPKHWSSASASVLPMKIQGWFPLGLTGLTMVHLQNYTLLFHGTFFSGLCKLSGCDDFIQYSFSWCFWITCCETLFVEPLLCAGYSEACVPYLKDWLSSIWAKLVGSQPESHTVSPLEHWCCWMMCL